MCEIFVGNISDDVAVHTIKEEFGRFGPIVDVRFDIASAFIRYESEVQAEDAIREMDGVDFCGEKLRVEIPQVQNTARNTADDDSYFDEIGDPDDSPERHIIDPDSRSYRDRSRSPGRHGESSNRGGYFRGSGDFRGNRGGYRGSRGSFRGRGDFFERGRGHFRGRGYHGSDDRNVQTYERQGRDHRSHETDQYRESRGRGGYTNSYGRGCYSENRVTNWPQDRGHSNEDRRPRDSISDDRGQSGHFNNDGGFRGHFSEDRGRNGRLNENRDYYEHRENSPQERGHFSNGNRGRGGPTFENRGRGGPTYENQGRGGPIYENRGRGGPVYENRGRGAHTYESRGRGGPTYEYRGRGSVDRGYSRGYGSNHRGDYHDTSSRGYNYDSDNRGRGGYRGRGRGFDDSSSRGSYRGSGYHPRGPSSFFENERPPRYENRSPTQTYSSNTSGRFNYDKRRRSPARY